MNATLGNHVIGRTVRRWFADNGLAGRFVPAQDTYDVACGLAIADMYEAMTHDPRDPLVRASYRQLIAELCTQYEYIVKFGGITVEPWFGEGEPYRNSREMIADVRKRRHLYFLRTKSAFGDGEQPSDCMMLAPTGVVLNGYELVANDLSRISHDYYGHARFAHRFGSLGEENAWRAHLPMLSLLAIPAFTTETRGQSSWFNFGPHLRDAEGRVPGRGEPGYIEPPRRPFPAQKNALLPAEASGVRLYQDPGTGAVVAEALPDWEPTESVLRRAARS